VLYVYGITDAPRCPLMRGLEGAALTVTGEDGVFAVYSEHTQARLEADEGALWEHENVVEAMLAGATVLPLRFGSWIEDHEGLRRMLRERRDEFALGLDRVRGAVEIGVRALIHSEPAELSLAAANGDRPGTTYMLGRLNEEKRSSAVAARIHEPLAVLSRASTPRRTSLVGATNTAYLVDRDDVSAFRSLVEELDDGLVNATVLCTGPWPPYSFTPERMR
jgi:hypothetical protein